MTLYGVRITQFAPGGVRVSETTYPTIYAERANALAFRAEVARGQIELLNFVQVSVDQHELWLENRDTRIQLFIVEFTVMDV